jgi:long-chain acyl-CoA synthetase
MTINNEITFLQSLEKYAADKPDAVYLVDRDSGNNISYTFNEVKITIEAIAKSLVTLFPSTDESGIGQRISILAKNRAHWSMCDFGVLRSGHILAPVFGTMPPKAFRYAMEFADIKLLFVGETGNWEDVKGEIAADVVLVALPGVELAEVDYTFEEFLALGIETPLPAHPDVDAPATIVFTSGTTGMPKGVLHSLKTLGSFVDGIVGFSGEQSRFFSYLPLAHLGDRAATVFQSARVGGLLTFNDSVATFTEDMTAAAPTFLMGVPRIWEKLLQGVLLKTGIEPEQLKAKLAEPGGAELAKQVRAGLGLQNIDFLVAATAPTSGSIKEWYSRLGMPLHDVYGQTELCPITCSPGATDGRVGVGPVLAGYEVKIADSGEILGRGPAMALGYYNNPEKTAEIFVDGWVHTGDKGRFDEQGNLHITGRVQDTFKTAKGKYVAPVPIEDKFSSSPLVEQQCMYGFGLTQPVMIFTLSETAPADQSAVESHMRDFVVSLNPQLEPHERIGGLIICKSPWTPESGVLTHTLKVQRARVEDAYRESIETLGNMMQETERSIEVLWV